MNRNQRSNVYGSHPIADHLDFPAREQRKRDERPDRDGDGYRTDIAKVAGNANRERETKPCAEEETNNPAASLIFFVHNVNSFMIGHSEIQTFTWPGS